MKQCIKCKKWFLPDDVSKQGYCKICVRDYDWQRRRNITPPEYARLFNQQKGGCAICNKNYKDEHQMFAVDHNHITEEIRGLLCRNCNVAIGLFKETPAIVLRAYFYLKGFKMDDYTDNLIEAIDVLSNILKELKMGLEEVKTIVDSHTKELEYIRKTF